MFWVQNYIVSNSDQGSENKINPIFKKSFSFGLSDIYIAYKDTKKWPSEISESQIMRFESENPIFESGNKNRKDKEKGRKTCVLLP